MVKFIVFDYGNNTMAEGDPSLTYRDAGVNIDAGNELVERIKPHSLRTKRPEILSGVGGFGALMAIPPGYEYPVLVSGTDGVGTKLKLALETGIFDTIGIDLVAMCVNDIIVSGAEPLFFLDYYSTGKLDIDVAEKVIKGIADGCLEAGAALTGGETAEMPGMYENGDFDLAGFCVGVVERHKILDRSQVYRGDALIGLGATGPHSNGYSLIRKIIDVNQISLDMPFGEETLGEVLLKPTRIYAKIILKLLKNHDIHTIAHITGGGLSENLPRVLPNQTEAIITRNSWEQPEIFNWLQEQGNIEDSEMLRTFNCGIGMVIAVPQKAVDDILTTCRLDSIPAWVIGEVGTTEAETPVVRYVD